MMTRRSFVTTAAAAALGTRLARAEALEPPFPFTCPGWFRDAKFGIWAHWSAQCVPEQGDWYARNMYIQGLPQYEHHLRTYGHPSQFGFKQIDHLWRAERWDPDALVGRYRRAGAKYFVALANHHDNFDNFDSTHHAWNSVRIGPRRDLIAGWAAAARRHGLPFGVSSHASHAWHWFQVAYAYDPEGPMAGVRYDGPSAPELYTGPRMVAPDGIRTMAAMQQWHAQHDGRWYEDLPAGDPFVAQWQARTRELISRYVPDFLYFDDTGIPFGARGREVIAHLYRTSIAHYGANRAIATGKRLNDEERRLVLEDFERGFSERIEPLPWQTDTCIGDWHYKRDIRYKTVGDVVRMLLDIVSKNGNLLLNIPVRGDGTIDSREDEFVAGLTAWMDVHGEGIFGTRPWRVFGEGPPHPAGGMFAEGRAHYGAQDIRFTSKGGTLYAHVLGLPTEPVRIAALGRDRCARIDAVALLGGAEAPAWRQTPAALEIAPPRSFPAADTAAFRITFSG